MNDNILNAALLGLLVAVALAAGGSLESSSRRNVAPAADLPVVMLPAVAVVGKRLAPADAVAQVVQLPAVEVTGRRVPTMEPVTLAHAE